MIPENGAPPQLCLCLHEMRRSRGSVQVEFLALGLCVWVISRAASAGFQQQTRGVNYKEVIKRSLQTYYSQFHSDCVMAPFGGDATVKIAGYWFGKKPNMSWPVSKMEPIHVSLTFIHLSKSIHFLSQVGAGTYPGFHEAKATYTH